MLAGGGILLVAALFGLIGLGRGVTEAPDTATFHSETFTTPVDTSLDLTQGGYDLFENTGRDGIRPVTLDAGDVAVTGPDGAPVPLRDPAARTIDVGSEVYRAVGFLRVPADGRYRVSVTSSDGGTVQVFVTDDGTTLLLGRDAYAMWPVVLGAFVAAVGLGVLASGV